jgi:hypothetical protein
MDRLTLRIWWELEVRPALPMLLFVGAAFAAFPVMAYLHETGESEWLVNFFANPIGPYWSLRMLAPFLMDTPPANVNRSPWVPPALTGEAADS